MLLGGGHAHVEVLRRWGFARVPGVRLTLVSRDLQTPYSGMLPGYTSGWYSFAEAHIDLRRLGQHAKAAAVIQAEATGIDIQVNVSFTVTDAPRHNGARAPAPPTQCRATMWPHACWLPRCRRATCCFRGGRHCRTTCSASTQASHQE